jgi:DNA (cytosine-5)-methyltransferase 1
LAELNAAEYGVPQLRHRVVLLGLRGAAPKIPAPTHSFPDDKKEFSGPRAVSAGEALEGLDDTRYAEPEETVSGRWANELFQVPPGMNYKALTAWAGHPNPVFEPETRFWNFLLKLHPERPSWTIAANPGPWVGPFHWQDRRLRTPELAALQSFPRGYAFAGKRRERVRQIGNAMPPLLSEVMVRSLLDTMGEAR